MFNRSLKSFVPSTYSDVVEMDALIEAQENVIDVARREMYSAFANTFVLTADLSGVIMFESMLGIVANAQTENLEFRRQRIINRLSMKPPFTFRFLKNRLDEIMGEGAWKGYVDFNNYTLYIESSAANQSWYSEVEFTVNRVKPCNIVFVNVPLTAVGVKISEEISYTSLKWMYRLSSWKLGKNPFSTQEGGGMIKMAGTKSVQSMLLGDTANFVASDIHSVIINDSIEINDFKLKEVSGNVVSVEYTVTPDMTTLISDIKLRREDGAVLTHASVYVPVSNVVVSKHTITVKEGA